MAVRPADRTDLMAVRSVDHTVDLMAVRSVAHTDLMGARLEVRMGGPTDILTADRLAVMGNQPAATQPIPGAPMASAAQIAADSMAAPAVLETGVAAMPAQVL